ncbi:hypothetical protein Tco_0385021 [Tanacetum coccineum]
MEVAVTSLEKCKVIFSEHDSEITKDGKIIGQQYMVYINLVVSNELVEEEAIKVSEKKPLGNDVEYEVLENDEIINIKESKSHLLENVIGNLNQRTLRSQAQDKSNFFCFLLTIEPKNVDEALKDESWVVVMQEELNKFTANDVWELFQILSL